MVLYHGTSESRARQILQSGLQPRGKGRPSFPDINSYSNMVYLTSYGASAYAYHVALKTKEKWGILEIDVDKLDPALIYPEQGYIIEPLVDVGTDDKIVEALLKQEAKGLEQYQPQWEDCLKKRGSVAYKGIIPPNCITRAAIYDPESNPELLDRLISTQLGTAAFEVLNKRLTAATRWVFNDQYRIYDFFPLQLQSALWEIPPEEIQEMKRQLAIRTGIQQIHP
jgi:hypothetical protein